MSTSLYYPTPQNILMLTKLGDVPSHVAAFTATGEVTKEDYDNVLVPELERIDQQHGHIHYLMIMETPVKNFSLGAWMQDILQGLKHFRGWKKIAIVTDEKGVEKFSDLFTSFIPGETKGFSLAQTEAAKKWVVKNNYAVVGLCKIL